jgi:hypothetical protein
MTEYRLPKVLTLNQHLHFMRDIERILEQLGLSKSGPSSYELDHPKSGGVEFQAGSYAHVAAWQVVSKQGV